MNTKTKVLIGDNTTSFGIPCSELLITKGFDPIVRNKNGNDIVESIRYDQPDIVIMEAFMPAMDAVSVMIKTKSFNQKQPKFIVISSHDNPYIEKEAIDNGASCYLVKPVEIEYVCSKISTISKKAANPEPNSGFFSSGITLSDSQDLEVLVTEVILQVGIPAHIKGYHYLREAIMLSITDKEMINSITKILYPTIAKTFNTTSSRVERAIRHAIELAWDRGDIDILNNFFGFTIHNVRGKPTNSEFIAMISDKLRLKLKKTLLA